MAGSDVRAGGAFVEVGLKANIDKGVRAIQAKMKALSGSLTTMGTALTAAGGAVLAPLAAATAAFSAQGDAVEKMAARTGLSAEAISELSFAAGQSGTSIETLEKGIRKMQDTIIGAADGTQSQIDALAALGLSVDDLKNKSPEEQFMLLSSAIGSISDPAERTSRAMDIFGKSGTELLPMFAAGADGIAALREEAKKLGHQLTTEDAAAAAALNDSWGRVSATLKGITLQVGAALAPTITELSNTLAELLTKAVDWIRNNRTIIVTIAAVAAGVTVAGTALLGLAGVTGIIATVAGSILSLSAAITAAGGVAVIFSTIMAGVGAVVGAILSPIGLAVGAVLALAAVVASTTDVVSVLLSTFTQTASGILAALSAGEYVKAAQILWAGLTLAWYQGIDKILEAFQYLWDNGFTLAKNFFVGFAKLAWQVFSSIPQLLYSALGGGSTFSEILAGALEQGLEGGIGGALDKRVAEAKAELDRLTASGPPSITGPDVPNPGAQQMAAAAAEAQQQYASPTATSLPLIQSDQARAAAVGGSDERLELIGQQQLEQLKLLVRKPAAEINQARF